MKFCHISDTHLGYSAYRKLHKNEGINLREVDIRTSFENAVNKIIKLKPDFVIHTGDLFDSYRPNNRTVIFTIKKLLELAETTKLIIISGNHSTPRTANYGSVFEVLEFFPQIKVIYKGHYETVQISNTLIHDVPECIDDKQIHKELKKIKLDENKHNVIAVHCGLSGHQEYSMDEFGETLLPEKYLNMDFDYIALGHFHRFSKINKKTYYAGSTERTSFNEASEEKGFIIYNLENSSLAFEELDIRKMIDLSLECANLDSKAVNGKLLSLLKKNSIEEAIVKIKLLNLNPQAYRELDNEEISRITKNCTQFSINPKILSEKDGKELNSEIGNIEKEFTDFINKRKESHLADIGLQYLRQAKEDETD